MKYVLIILIVMLGAAALYFKDHLLLSPHDSYYSALLREDLKATAERWKMEAEKSLAAPLHISLPYSERRLLEADYLQPITFAFDLQVDELIQINIFPSINTRAEVFVDVFYVKDATTEPAPRWLSINTEKANLRSGPSLATTTVDSLMRGELVQVDSVAGDWLRITTGKGAQGFIARRLAETPAESVLTLTENHVAFSLPDDTAPVLGNFSAGDKLPTLGQFGGFAWIKMPGGVYAWAKVAKQEITTLE